MMHFKKEKKGYGIGLEQGGERCGVYIYFE